MTPTFSDPCGDGKWPIRAAFPAPCLLIPDPLWLMDSIPKNSFSSSLLALSIPISPISQKTESLSRAQLLAPRIIWSSTILGRNRHGKGRGWLDPREEPCPVKITGKISVGRQIMNQILAWKAASTSFFFRKERIWITGSGHRNFSSCLPERKTLKRILANKFRGVSVESLTALSGKLHLCGAVSHPEIPPRKSSFA